MSRESADVSSSPEEPSGRHWRCGCSVHRPHNKSLEKAALLQRSRMTGAYKRGGMC